MADIMRGRCLPASAPFLMLRFRPSILPFALLATAFAQTAKPAPTQAAPAGPERAIKLAQSGHCEEAVPGLKAAVRTATDKSTKRTAAFAGVRCAMLINQT